MRRPVTSSATFAADACANDSMAERMRAVLAGAVPWRVVAARSLAGVYELGRHVRRPEPVGMSDTGAMVRGYRPVW